MNTYSFIYIIATLLLVPSVSFARTPNDPYASQWGYEHVGVYSAWNYSIGSDAVVVAVIDNGFDTFHPDLRDNVWKNSDELPDNGIDDDHNGYIDDVYGWNFLDKNNNPRPDVDALGDVEMQDGIFHHGTIVAGIIGARGDNGRDGTGINWRVKLMNLKVLGNSGIGDLEPLVDAIYYAVANGADIINISMVGDGVWPEINNAIQYAYTHDVVVVAAAGNNMTNLDIDPQYPVCSDKDSGSNQVIGVSAINEDHYLATFSNYGSDCIDITAPGVGIQSTLRYSPSNNLLDTYTRNSTWNGTSFSAPFVSGAAALLKAMAPGFSAEKIMHILGNTTHHTPAADENVYADTYGKGLLQIDKAVIQAQSDLDNEADNTTDTVTEDIIDTNSNSSDTNIQDAYQPRLLFISPQTGLYEFRQGGAMASKALYRATFSQVRDIQDFVDKNNNKRYFATLHGDTTQKSLYVYDDRMRLDRHFPVDNFSLGDIAVGDIDGDGFHEYIVASWGAGSTHIVVYTSTGVVRYRDTIPNTQAFLSVDVSYNNTRQADDIIFMYVVGDDTIIEQLYDELYLAHSFDIASFVGGELLTHDVNADGTNEYLVAAAPDHQALIHVYTTAGTLSDSFRGYPPQMKSGVDMTVYDYNNDDIQELVITSRSGGSPTRIMTMSGEVLEAWWPFDDENSGRVFALGL